MFFYGWTLTWTCVFCLSWSLLNVWFCVSNFPEKTLTNIQLSQCQGLESIPKRWFSGCLKPMVWYSFNGVEKLKINLRKKNCASWELLMGVIIYEMSSWIVAWHAETCQAWHFFSFFRGKKLNHYQSCMSQSHVIFIDHRTHTKNNG